MTSTPHLALPLLAAAQAQKHVTHNEALASLDALVQLAVKERNRTGLPASPAEGDRFLVGAGATGAFANQEGNIALFDLGAWRFFTPRPGWLAYVGPRTCSSSSTAANGRRPARSRKSSTIWIGSGSAPRPTI